MHKNDIFFDKAVYCLGYCSGTWLSIMKSKFEGIYIYMCVCSCIFWSSLSIQTCMSRWDADCFGLWAGCPCLLHMRGRTVTCTQGHKQEASQMKKPPPRPRHCCRRNRASMAALLFYIRTRLKSQDEKAVKGDHLNGTWYSDHGGRKRLLKTASPSPHVSTPTKCSQSKYVFHHRHKTDQMNSYARVITKQRNLDVPATERARFSILLKINL